MIKIENVEVVGWEAAIRGMRNPLESWDKSDSQYCTMRVSCDECPAKSVGGCIGYGVDPFVVGPADHDLMMRLRHAGTDHRKYMRMIVVYADITCHHTWWAELDTYKVGTVRNSCSKMHKIHVKPFSKDDFSHEGIDKVGGFVASKFESYINTLEYLRVKFNDTQEKKYWRALIEMLPLGFNLRATIELNYEVLANMYRGRHNHKLFEWRDFCKWIESLPYSEIITGKKPDDGEPEEF